MQSKFFASFALCFLMHTISASFQDFQLMRFDENYERLKDSVHNFYNTLKFLPLSKNKKVFGSFGGEARLEHVSMYNESWARFNTGHNNFFLQRYAIHGDLHIGYRFRVFSQLRSA
jgi:hypothetical protein